MLPDIRAVIAAVFAAAGLIMIAFGAVATFRVAQENHSGSLQADLAKRGRAEPPAVSEKRQVLIVNLRIAIDLQRQLTFLAELAPCLLASQRHNSS